MAGDVCPSTRWAWVEIDLDAIKSNTMAFRRIIRPRSKMMCVVKANAYGHGAVRCAQAMLRAGADEFAVATVQEGVELRESGIDVPIALLSEPPVESVELLVQHNIQPAVYTRRFALALGECAASHNRVAGYNLAVDTGMTRIGVSWNDALEFRRSLEFHRGLKCVGIFTHFATADVPGDWDFDAQVKRFQEAVRSIKGAGLSTGLVHCDNTPATVLHPELDGDMVRVGIGLYGLHPADSTRGKINLVPAMSVRGRVTRVIEPEVGMGVGYGLTYRVTTPHIQVATVPIGYADGLARQLSNRMEVLVRGKRCRQVGRVCMDQFMFANNLNAVRADRPATPVEYGDVVTVMGRDGSESISADDLAALLDTINYEVVCDFGLRLERVYV